jgi:hypothetical protein
MLLRAPFHTPRHTLWPPAQSVTPPPPSPTPRPTLAHRCHPLWRHHPLWCLRPLLHHVVLCPPPRPSHVPRRGAVVGRAQAKRRRVWPLPCHHPRPLASPNRSSPRSAQRRTEEG